MKKLTRIVLIILIFGIGSIYGYCFHKYNIFPRNQINKIRLFFSERGAFSSGPKDRFMRTLFTEKLYEGTKIKREIKDYTDLAKVIDSIIIPLYYDYSLYDSIKIFGTENFNLDGYEVLRVKFSLFGRNYNSYCYQHLVGKSKGDTCLFIIPGSNPNQSSQIISENPENYHYGLYTELKNRFDSYVYVKPNEDFLAWHDGKKKVSGIA